MSLTTAIRVALDALLVNKGRSALTSLGIVIGIMAVIAMVAAGNGARQELDKGLDSVGKTLILIRPGSRTSMGITTSYVPLTAEDVRALRDDPELAEMLNGIAETQHIPQAKVSSLSTGNKHDTTIVGTIPGIKEVRAWETPIGRFFTQEDLDKAATVCLIGQTVYEKLFPYTEDPTGEQVRIHGKVFTVIGVLGAKGYAPTGSDQDDQVFIPMTTLQQKLALTRRVDLIAASAKSPALIAPAVERIQQVMTEARQAPGERPEDNFQVSSVQEMSNLAVMIARTLNILIIIIASISLVVGGIGIMNIMLVSVTERTREIGIRMAVGATTADVRNQFLIEAVVLSLVGGALGIALGIGCAVTLTLAVNWPILFDPFYTFLAFGVAAAVGVFFGLYPAIKASRLDPIEALRYE